MFCTGLRGSYWNFHYWMNLAFYLCSSCQIHVYLLTYLPSSPTQNHLPHIIRATCLGMSCQSLFRSPLKEGNQSPHRQIRQIGLSKVGFIVFLIFGFHEGDSFWMKASYFESNFPPAWGTACQNLLSWGHLHYEPSFQSTSSLLFQSDETLNIQEMTLNWWESLLTVLLWSLFQWKGELLASVLS